MKIGRLIQNHLLKRRLIFCSYTIPNAPNVLPGAFGYSLFGQSDILNEPAVRALLPMSVRIDQLEDESLFCLACHEEATASLVGVGFLLAPRAKSLWYDNVVLRPGEARCFGDYVNPAFRGRGIGSALNAERIRLAMQEIGVSRTSAIVESFRTPALKAQSKYSKRCGTNLLIKLFKRNVISICFGQPYRGVWYVGPGRQRSWHVEQF